MKHTVVTIVRQSYNWFSIRGREEEIKSGRGRNKNREGVTRREAEREKKIRMIENRVSHISDLIKYQSTSQQPRKGWISQSQCHANQVHWDAVNTTLEKCFAMQVLLLSFPHPSLYIISSHTTLFLKRKAQLRRHSEMKVKCYNKDLNSREEALLLIVLPTLLVRTHCMKTKIWRTTSPQIASWLGSKEVNCPLVASKATHRCYHFACLEGNKSSSEEF